MFTHTRFTKFAGTAVAAAALGLAAVATAGPASAAAVDDAYLQALQAEGIGYDSPQGAISGAHAVCQSIDQGEVPVDVMGDILAVNDDLTPRQAAVIVVSSVVAYCPQHEPALSA